MLCAGCGTCAGICPNNAVEMIIDKSNSIYVPAVNEEKCIVCGLCYNVCPGHGVDFNELTSFASGKIGEDIAAGRWIGCYTGNAKDNEIRYNSSSGGIVTALLIFALDEGLIDGALVTKMKSLSPLEPKPFVARTREEIISAAGSKYCPVPTNVALREILKMQGKFAVVGLPCHIHGIRKAEKNSKVIREKIALRIGIACSLNWSFRATEKLLENLNIAIEQVQKLDYRGKGWPGSMTIQLRGGKEKTIPLREYYCKLSPYPPTRCTLCSDALAELADISCGDAWLPEITKNDNIGTSFVISRSGQGEQLLKEAASKQILELRPFSIDKMLQSQGNALFKKKNLKARMLLFKLVGKKVPIYKQMLIEPELNDYVKAVKFYLTRYILSGKNRVILKLFNRIRHLKHKIAAKKGASQETMNCS